MKHVQTIFFSIVMGGVFLLAGCSSVPKKTPPSPPPLTPIIVKKLTPYTQVGLTEKLTPYIVQGSLKSLKNNTPLSLQLLLPKLEANVLQVPYFAYQDYRLGKITKAQYLTVVQNTQPSSQAIRDQFLTVNSVVLNYPKKSTSIGMSYVETIGKQKSWNSVRCVDLQSSLMALVPTIYSENNPEKIYQTIQQFAQLLQQSSLLSFNNNADITSVTMSNFQESWLTKEGYYTINYIYALIPH